MFKKTKRIIMMLVLAALLLLGLTACAGKNKPTDQPDPQTPAVVQEESTPEQTEPPETQQPTSEQTTPMVPETQPPSQNWQKDTDQPDTAAEGDVEEGQWYYDKDHVAAYLNQYGELPGNYMTKGEARKLGWSGGSLERYAKGRVIGGDTFGNREGLLPKKNGRKYYECDIDTNGKSERGTKRIIYSNDGLIYYTDDHYRSFTLLYGEE